MQYGCKLRYQIMDKPKYVKNEVKQNCNNVKKDKV